MSKFIVTIIGVGVVVSSSFAGVVGKWKHDIPEDEIKSYGVISFLVLKKDHTFEQYSEKNPRTTVIVEGPDKVLQAKGTWKLKGNTLTLTGRLIKYGKVIKSGNSVLSISFVVDAGERAMSRVTTKTSYKFDAKGKEQKTVTPQRVTYVRSE